MTTLRCPTCLRRWRAGGPYACDCLHTAEPPANEYEARVAYALAPLRCLVGVRLLSGWATWSALGSGVRGLLHLLGVRP